jgi:hypothetical protein
MGEVFEVDTRSGEDSETDVMRQSLTFHHIPYAERYAAHLMHKQRDRQERGNYLSLHRIQGPAGM